MKTIIRGLLMIIAALLICNNSRAQALRASFYRYGVYDRDRYNYTPFEECDIPIDFVLKSHYIYFHTQEPFTITLRDVTESSHWDSYVKGTTSMWQAYDNSYRRCKVRFTFFRSGSMQVMLFYDDMSFIYQIDKDNGMDALMDD
jgi:hypothetical protein